VIRFLDSLVRTAQQPQVYEKRVSWPTPLGHVPKTHSEARNAKFLPQVSGTAHGRTCYTLPTSIEETAICSNQQPILIYRTTGGQ
jgi:hypothetical protein